MHRLLPTGSAEKWRREYILAGLAPASLPATHFPADPVGNSQALGQFAVKSSSI